VKNTPKSFRVHIGIFGRRNVGKSSLLNAITRQNISIVSNTAGTTTDPVEKPMELLPLGPVLFIDTAGVDDIGDLGRLRIEKTRAIFNRTDLGVLVTEANSWGEFEESILNELLLRKIPVIIVLNKIDLHEPDNTLQKRFEAEKHIKVILVSTVKNEGILDLRQAILDQAPAHFFENPSILRDLLKPQEVVIHVIPIDREAPKGRLLLPQAQAIRDSLDGDLISIAIKETELESAIKALKQDPALVVTDSSAFNKVAKLVPQHIPLTGYSILFTRMKGDLKTQVLSTLTIETLKPNDRVLIAEACTHHPICDDIGRCKLPRALQNKLGFNLQFDFTEGHDFPKDLSPYKLVIHCGACMFNRRALLTRLLLCEEAGVPMTNYGLVFAYCMDLFDRALKPFKEVYKAYLEHKTVEN